MKKIICLDFDGVICNSLDECMIVSYNAYNNKNIKTISKIEKDFKEFFYKYRYLVRPACEFYLLLKLYDLNIEVLNRDIYESYKKRYTNEIRFFHDKFYAKRFLLKCDIEKWIRLNNIYENAKNFLSKENEKFYIVTNKDKKSVEDILKYYGYMSNVIDIYSMEISTNKVELLNLIIKKNSFNNKIDKITFVDDSIENIKKIFLFNEKIKCYFASWGYEKEISGDFFKKIDNLDFLIARKENEKN